MSAPIRMHVTLEVSTMSETVTVTTGLLQVVSPEIHIKSRKMDAHLYSGK